MKIITLPKKESMRVKIDKTWHDAYKRYAWQSGTEGLCIDYSTMRIAQMAGKNLQFVIKKRKKGYLIDPDYAEYVVKEHNSVFTRRRDRKPVAVIPSFACREVLL